MEFDKLFTHAEAEGTLPLVRRIVADILSSAQLARQRARVVAAGAVDEDAEMGRHKANIAEYVGEIEALGAFFKDWDMTVGLVDFPAVVNGETVLLCWRSDEDSLAFYHPVAAGYKGRRPLPVGWTGTDPD